jgi:hypothetical protein
MLSLDRQRYLTADLGSLLELGPIVIEVDQPAEDPKQLGNVRLGTMAHK